jgi:hypothetical protein
MKRGFFNYVLAAGMGLLLASGAAMGAYEFYMPSGQKVQGEMQGNRLFILVQGKRQVAPDGRYRTADGRFIIVQGGIAQADPSPKDPKGKGMAPASMNSMQRQGQGMQQMNQIPVPPPIVGQQRQQQMAR